MMDVSDGLLLDASRLAEASGVGVELERALLPIDQTARTLQLREEQLIQAALSGGEDYVLLFCSPSEPPPALGCVEIGRCISKQGLWLDGEPHAPQGYLHGAPSDVSFISSLSFPRSP
jgi:thiamine-monophosphate kinase